MEYRIRMGIPFSTRYSSNSFFFVYEIRDKLKLILPQPRLYCSSQGMVGSEEWYSICNVLEVRLLRVLNIIPIFLLTLLLIILIWSFQFNFEFMTTPKNYVLSTCSIIMLSILICNEEISILLPIPWNNI